MRIERLETILTNAGLRNYLFIRLTTDSGLTGLGEATLEWQERTVCTLIDEWVRDRVMGADPFEVEPLVGRLIRDQYQGGATVMTAISGVEIALWDLIGKARNQPVYELLGGRAVERLPAYANGWYGGDVSPARRTASPDDTARRAREVLALGYQALKFDPFGVAWKELDPRQMADAIDTIEAVREAVGDHVELMIEGHGRLSVASAIEVGRRMAEFRPAWFEEPVTPHSLDQLREVKKALPFPIAAGERLLMFEEFERLTAIRACDVVQMDVAHCGGLAAAKKIAALAQASGLRVSPHCSIGPVALCAALHFSWSTPNVWFQEDFSQFDAPWRAEFVHGWEPFRGGEFTLPGGAGLGIELNEDACAEHPYKPNAFPSLWDQRWLGEFTSRDRKPPP